MQTLQTLYKNSNVPYGDRVKPSLISNILNHPLGSPAYFATLYYRKSFDGNDLYGDELRDRWDITKVRKTHSFISKLIYKSFGDVPLWWFIERHDDYEDKDGNTKKGHFHSHLIIGNIDDEELENPSPYLMPLFYKDDDIGIPIGMRSGDIDQMKLLLLNACIRQAKWVGKHPASLKLDPIVLTEFENVLTYCIKDIKKADDFNIVIDWENSSFYKPA